MKRDRRISENVSDRGSVKREKERAKDRTLRDTSREWYGVRLVVEYRNELRAVREIGDKKGEGRASEAKAGMKSGKKYNMVNGIEGR